MYKLGDWISLADAVRFVAEKVYPGEEDRPARRRVRDRIRVHQRKANLPSGDEFDVAAFFGWAIRQKGWEALRQVPGLPVSRTVAVSPASPGEINVQKNQPDVVSVQVPKDPAQLRAEYIKAKSENLTLKRENTRLRQGNAVLRQVVKDWRAKDRKTRQKRKEAGKRGKGVPRHRN